MVEGICNGEEAVDTVVGSLVQTGLARRQLSMRGGGGGGGGLALPLLCFALLCFSGWVPLLPPPPLFLLALLFLQLLQAAA